MIIAAALLLREVYSSIVMKLTGGENELITLSGIATLILMVWLTEYIGISALAGIYAAGLILVDTELGFSVRERFSSVKDFFTALSFFSIGYLLTVPRPEYLVLATALVVFTSVLKPLLSAVTLKLLGYDLRTGFMAGIQTAQVTELAVLGSILIIPFTDGSVFEAMALAFTVSIMIAHLVEDHEQYLFEKLFSSYELDSEMTVIPRNLQDHVIIAGYDWKTRDLEQAIEKDILVIDYDIESIKEAARRDLPHLLADLKSEDVWKKASVDKASMIVSAINDQDLIEKIRDKEVDAEKILVEKDSEEVTERLREMLSDSLQEKKKKK
ncbi:MAG: hypothetical protein BRC27_01505 [Nanohaloarchaea archaeon SW_10_44_10]|nr:MAG: hypothetical protein BRC27_01505 [Nanohaloarchaea archaeon SW_10_44_10]